MPFTRPLWPRVWGALALYAFAAAALAGQLSDADNRTLRSYALTVSKIQHYGAAHRAWEQAKKTDPRLRAEASNRAGEAQASLSDLRAKIARRPQTFAFFRAQGLSEDDVILIPLTCMYASAASMFSSPKKVPAEISAAVSPRQVQFVREHRRELEAAEIFTAPKNGGI